MGRTPPNHFHIYFSWLSASQELNSHGHRCLVYKRCSVKLSIAHFKVDFAQFLQKLIANPVVFLSLEQESRLSKLGLTSEIFQVDQGLFKGHATKFRTDAQDQLKSKLKEEFRAENKCHQHDNGTLFNVFNVVLEYGEEPLGCEILYRYVLLKQVEEHLWHLVVQEAFQLKDGFFEP